MRRGAALGLVGSARSDPSGAFAVVGLPPGVYRLRVYEDEGYGDAVDVGTAATGATDVVLRLPPR